jgi:hypothetical protein
MLWSFPFLKELLDEPEPVQVLQGTQLAKYQAPFDQATQVKLPVEQSADELPVSPVLKLLLRILWHQDLAG